MAYEFEHSISYILKHIILQTLLTEEQPWTKMFTSEKELLILALELQIKTENKTESFGQNSASCVHPINSSLSNIQIKQQYEKLCVYKVK